MSSSKDVVRVAVIQMSSQADLDQNLARVAELVGRAASEGAELIALPENFAYLGPPDGRRALAEKLDGSGPILRAVTDLARRHRIVLVAGAMPERSDDPARPYQTCVAVGSDGAVLAAYRKIHLYDVTLSETERYCESDSMTRGSEVVSVAARGFTMGLSICYDLRFPELYRRLVDRGAHLLLTPASFTWTTGKDHWFILVRARAIESQSYVVAAAQSGTDFAGRRTFGGSVIVDPWGDIVAQCSDGEGIAFATVDRARIEEVRRKLPSLEHRRLA